MPLVTIQLNASKRYLLFAALRSIEAKKVSNLDMMNRELTTEPTNKVHFTLSKNVRNVRKFI